MQVLLYSGNNQPYLNMTQWLGCNFQALCGVLDNLCQSWCSLECHNQKLWSCFAQARWVTLITLLLGRLTTPPVSHCHRYRPWVMERTDDPWVICLRHPHSYLVPVLRGCITDYHICKSFRGNSFLQFQKGTEWWHCHFDQIY